VFRWTIREDVSCVKTYTLSGFSYYAIEKHKHAAVYLHSCQEFHPPLRIAVSRMVIQKRGGKRRVWVRECRRQRWWMDKLWRGWGGGGGWEREWRLRETKSEDERRRPRGAMRERGWIRDRRRAQKFLGVTNGSETAVYPSS